MPKFTIDLEFCTSVMKNESYSTLEDPANPTNDDLIKILKGNHKVKSMWLIDHPEFTKLREQLGEEGYITIERGWWNGDRVVKPFTLNNTRFKKNDQFPSASAIKYNLTRT